MSWADFEVNPHFRLGELLPSDAQEVLGDPVRWFFEQGRGEWLDRVSLALRRQFGPMVVNDWLRGGEFNARGYRLPSGLSNIGGKGSRHRLGLALDCHFTQTPLKDVQRHLERHPEQWLRVGVARYERTNQGRPVTWLHVDAGVAVQSFNA